MAKKHLKILIRVRHKIKLENKKNYQKLAKSNSMVFKRRYIIDEILNQSFNLKIIMRIKLTINSKNDLLWV